MVSAVKGMVTPSPNPVKQGRIAIVLNVAGRDGAPGSSETSITTARPPKETIF